MLTTRCRSACQVRSVVADAANKVCSKQLLHQTYISHVIFIFTNCTQQHKLSIIIFLVADSNKQQASTTTLPSLLQLQHQSAVAATAGVITERYRFLL